MGSAITELVTKRLGALLGLKLSSIGHAADMRTFQFGVLRKVGKRLVGDYALHIQCPWRIDRSGAIIVGSKDWYEPFVENGERDSSFDPSKGRNLQEEVLRGFLKGFDADSRSIVNATDLLAVSSAQGSSSGGFELGLTGDYRLLVFPASLRQEAWRLFQPGSTGGHFVITGGRAES